MRTAHTRIDVAKGNLTMEFDGDVINFNIFESMRHPVSELNSCYAIDDFDSIAHVFSATTDQ